MISVGFNTLKLKIHEIFLAFWNAIETIELPYNAVICIKHNVGIYVYCMYILKERSTETHTHSLLCIQFFSSFFFSLQNHTEFK